MLRGITDVPIIIATARDDEQSVVRLLRAGADDYMVKPFTGAHLDARITTVLRRAGRASRTVSRPCTTVGGLRVDVGERSAVPRRGAAGADPQGVRPAGVPRRPTRPGGVPPGAVGGGMAAAVGRRGPDHRRAPVLATPKDGRVRGEAALPAHRAGGRVPAGGPGLRRALACSTRRHVHAGRAGVPVPARADPAQLTPASEALADAARRGAVVTGALAVSTDPAAVGRAIEATGDDPATRPVGARPRRRREPARPGLAAATWSGPAPSSSRWSPTSPGGLAYGWTRWCSATGSPWSRSSSPRPSSDGARRHLAAAAPRSPWRWSSPSVLVVGPGRRAGRRRRPGGWPRPRSRVGDGDLEVRVDPSGPRELAEAGLRVQPDGRPAGRRPHRRTGTGRGPVAPAAHPADGAAAGRRGAGLRRHQRRLVHRGASWTGGARSGGSGRPSSPWRARSTS